jgi:glycine oxidase
VSVPVLIVGAGIIGCAVARELAAHGVECEIVDERGVAGGATQASAGMLAPYVEAHEEGPLLHLGVRSLAMYDAWIDDIRSGSGVDVEYRRIGTLEIALDPQHATDLKHGAGGAGREWIEASAARDRHRALGAIDGAVFTSSHGYVVATQLAHALSTAALKRGARHVEARVTRVEPRDDGFAVHTTAGLRRAERVLLAAGAWTNALQVDGVSLPPVRPVRGQLLHLGWDAPPIETILWGPECYIVPRTNGTIMVGATVEDVGFDERTTAAGVRDLLDAACDLIPHGWGATFIGARVGLRPATPDELPVIGADATVAGLFHASGHYRNGVLLAPITASLIADLIVQKKSDPALDALRPDRF